MKILSVIIIALVVGGCDKSNPLSQNQHDRLFEQCRRAFKDIYTPADCEQYVIQRSRVENAWAKNEPQK